MIDPRLVEAIRRRAGRGMELGLDRMRRALADLENPERDLAVAHIAGTNGKGSVSSMVEAVAREAGLRTGLYTSPHLCRFAERIRVDGEPISDDAFSHALGRVFDRVSIEPTFFETMTLAAFDAFRAARVDLVVLEVGLGGRLDATNVVESPLVTAITSIAFDHIDMLGDSLGRIAREKAGIFKKGAPVVLGPLDPEADRAAEEVARSVGTGPLLRVARGRGPAEGWVVVGGGPDEIEIVPPPGFGRAIHTRLALAGRHQADNAAVAAMVALLLGARFEAIPAAVGRGLATARWPGRLERIERGEITVILDCAHNPHGARALAAALAEQGARPETTLLVFGALADKHWSEMLHILGPIAERRIYTSPQGRAPAAPSALAAICPGEVVERPGDAVERALAIARPGDRVVVAGSIYLVGEVRGALLGIDCDPIIAL